MEEEDLCGSHLLGCLQNLSPAAAVMLSLRWGTHQGLVRLGVLRSLGRFQTKEGNSFVNQGCQS